MVENSFKELDKWVSDKGTGGYIEYEYNPYICIKENFLNEELGIQQVREELYKLSKILELHNLTNGTCLEIGLGFFGSTHFLWRLLFDEVITIEKNFERVREFGRNTKKYYGKFILDDKRSKFYNGLSNDEKIVDAETIGGLSISAGTFPANVGSNGERFYLIFDEALFEETNVLRGEVDDYHLLVKKAMDAGSRFKFEVELVTDSATKSIPSEELAIGTRWSKFYSLSPSTLSYQGSKPYFTSPWRMENRPSTLRMEYEVAGNTINKGKNEPLEFGFNYKGQTESIWINYQDMVAHHQCEEMFARMLMYGKKNWTADHKYLNKDDKTKYAVESGAGFFDQIAPSNVHYYNTYDLDWHLELLLDMGVGKIERGKRTIHLLTGEFGAIEISKQINEKSGSGKFTVISDIFLRGDT